MNRYPALRLLTKHGQVISGISAIITLVFTLWAAYVSWSPLIVSIGVVLAAVIYGAIRSFCELVTLVTDMLLPKELE